MTETLAARAPTAQIVDALQDAWQTPGTGERPAGVTHRAPFTPIATSTEDQTSHTDNPLWDVVRWMPAEPPWPSGGLLEPTYVHNAFARGVSQHLDALGAGRQHLATRYSWSIITPGDIAWVAGQLDGRAVVDIGAGSGYWAWQLEQAGIDVAAYDPHPSGEDNTYCKGGPYTTVLRDDASAVAHHQDRALLMVWPPYGGSHARHALSVYEGDLLLYAGESWGGCTAEDGFYDLLGREWVEVSEAPRHVTWWGVHCGLRAYRRRGGDA